jgi:hypothetical protein
VASRPDNRLPPGIDIQKLPVLGTSWYERGADYWVRRVWLFLLMALVVTLTSLLVGLALAQFVLVIGSVLFFGLYVMLLSYALLPEYPSEHMARLRLAQQLGLYEAKPRQPLT